MRDLSNIWVYLSASPPLHLTLTLAAYQIGLAIYRRTKLNPLFNPVLVSVVLIVSVLLATSTRYETYFGGAQFVHFLLGPATVALDIPLYRQLELVRRSALALLVSIVAGSLTAAFSAMAIGWALRLLARYLNFARTQIGEPLQLPWGSPRDLEGYPR